MTHLNLSVSKNCLKTFELGSYCPSFVYLVVDSDYNQSIGFAKC